MSDAAPTVSVRPLRGEETRLFLEIHHAAVHGLAKDAYPQEVIDAWAPLPILARDVEQTRENPDGERRLAALVGGKVVGIGAVVLGRGELRACYVSPDAARQQVGTALVRKMEEKARGYELEALWLDASTNAEPFYAALGYEVVERGHHALRSDLAMPCVKMRKSL